MSQALLEVKNLKVYYPVKVRKNALASEKRFVKAVDDISFTVEQGEIVGFLGPNGAGKTTTMNILTGCLSATSGRVLIDGIDILENPMEAKRRIGYLPEQPPLYQDMTVREYLLFVAELKGTRKKADRIAAVENACARTGLQEMEGRLIRNLSKGYRQRVGIAQALIGNPPVLILDEPTVGLDPNQIIEIRSLIKSLGKHHTVILSSHILPEVEAVCDRLVIINGGRIVADDTANNLSLKYSKDRRLTARIAGPEKDVKTLIGGIGGVREIAVLGEKEPGVNEYLITPEPNADIRRELFTRLAGRSWPLLGLKSAEMTLEDIFVMLTRERAVTGTKGGKKK